jgi:hypothetical protein
MPQYVYQAYCLSFHSELALPELPSIEQAGIGSQADVTIRLGRVSACDSDSSFRQYGPFLWARTGALTLQIPTVASFLVRDGREIVVEPVAGIDEASVRVFLLGSALGALLMQRGLLVLHGNAIRIGEQGIICVGHSGAGKSTVAAAFAQQGYDLLADDVVAIDRSLCVLPGIPRVKLWSDSATQLGVDTEHLDAVRPGMEKYNLPIDDGFYDRPLPVGGIYVLATGDAVHLSAIRGMQRFVALQSQLYRRTFLEGLGLSQEMFMQCGHLAGQVRMGQLVRPRDLSGLDSLVESLRADMCERCP